MDTYKENNFNDQINFEEGIVLENRDNKSLVEVLNKARCATCSHSWMCTGNRDLSKIEVKNPINAKIGDKVIFKYSEKEVYKFSLLLYGIPLFMFVIGGIIGYFLPDISNLNISNDLRGLIFSFIFLGASFFLLKRIARFFIRKKNIFPEITKISRKYEK